MAKFIDCSKPPDRYPLEWSLSVAERLEYERPIECQMTCEEFLAFQCAAGRPVESIVARGLQSIALCLHDECFLHGDWLVMERCLDSVTNRWRGLKKMALPGSLEREAARRSAARTAHSAELNAEVVASLKREKSAGKVARRKPRKVGGT
jgi:hypothetical protein